jgi:hypothetical protein
MKWQSASAEHEGDLLSDLAEMGLEDAHKRKVKFNLTLDLSRHSSLDSASSMASSPSDDACVPSLSLGAVLAANDSDTNSFCQLLPTTPGGKPQVGAANDMLFVKSLFSLFARPRSKPLAVAATYALISVPGPPAHAAHEQEGGRVPAPDVRELVGERRGQVHPEGPPQLDVRTSQLVAALEQARILAREQRLRGIRAILQRKFPSY